MVIIIKYRTNDITYTHADMSSSLFFNLHSIPRTIFRCTKQNITIIILDENEYAPKFVKSRYRIKMPESSDVGSYVATCIAKDGDSVESQSAIFKNKVIYNDEIGFLLLSNVTKFLIKFVLHLGRKDGEIAEWRNYVYVESDQWEGCYLFTK